MTVAFMKQMRTYLRHYSDIIISAMASLITGVPGFFAQPFIQRQIKVTGLCEGDPLVTGGFPSQRASNAENISI